MNIVHLAALYEPHIGGVERHLAFLTAQLQLRGHACTVITQLHDARLAKNELLQGVTVCRIDAMHTSKLGHKFKIWKGMWRLRHHLFNADVIQVHDVFYWMLPFILFFRHKTYMTFHGHESNAGVTFWQKFWHTAAWKVSKKSLCIGNFHQDYYGVKADEISYGVVSNSLLLSNQKVVKKKKDHIAYVGRVCESNGIFEYLQAVKILLEQGKKYHLDVYGGGDCCMQKAKEYVKQHKLPVSFHGFIPDADQKLKEYWVAYVSRYLAILESLASNTGVVAHYDTQFKKAYLQTAEFSDWIHIVQSPQEIAKKTVELFDTNQPSKKAMKWARAQTVEKLADIYEKIWN